MAKMRAEQSKFAESMKSSENEGHDVPMLDPDVSSSTSVAPEEPLPVCSLCRDSDSKSPLCYLILLQKSRLSTFVEMGNPTWDNPTQANKTSGSVKKEDAADSSVTGSSDSEDLVHDTTAEPSFDLENMEVDAFLDLSNEQNPLTRYISSFPSGHGNSNADDTVSLEAIEADIYNSILNDLSEPSNAHIQDYEQALSSSASNIDSKKTRSPKRSVLGTYVSCLSAKHHHSSLYDVASKSSASASTRNRFGPIHCDGIHISSCGHAVHQECHDRYLFSLKQRYVRRLGFEGGHIVDPDLIASRGRVLSQSAESKSCLESLRGELNSSSGFILSLLFRVAHTARNLNRLEVLLRFEGFLPPMVDPGEGAPLFPDVQFWKQCADPVLAQDPFSSLMSTLFCLPVQFLSSAEFFVPLVHLFYVVCAIQLNKSSFCGLDISRCHALIAAQCLMNRHCVCFVANYVRLVGSHAAGDNTLLFTASALSSVRSAIMMLFYFDGRSVQKTTILLQRSARLAFWPSPYLDAFGEEDHEMHRGKPLYLSQERYAALTYLVASHSLDRTSEVLRQTTISFYGSD
nr:unnamed protein product [Digitaria exilis]